MKVRLPKNWKVKDDVARELLMLVMKLPRGMISADDLIDQAYKLCKPYVRER